MTWAAIAVGVVGAGTAAYSASKSGGGGGGYQPQGSGVADADWLASAGAARGISGDVNATASPLYLQALQKQQAINYDPYQQAAQRAGQQYEYLGDLSATQGQQYGQQAMLAGQQQRNLYGASDQIYQTAFDPQQAQFTQGQQRLQDQVRAGQAARGLGNSGVGAGEEDQAMQNYDLAWRQQQLQNQTQGLQAMSGASNAGGAQGQLVGANLTGQMGAYGSMPGFTQQGAQVPLSAQQYVAGMPAQNAGMYSQNMANTQNLYNNQMNQDLSYMGMAGPQMLAQQKFGADQAQLQGQELGQFAGYGAGAATKSYNTPGSWLNNLFSSSGSSGGQGATSYNDFGYH